MGGARALVDADADGGVRSCGAARRRGDDDPRHLPVGVRVYHAEGCHLCERALATVRAARDELGFELEEVDIGGDDALEAEYREWLPVVEIDGARAFVYYVDPAALRRRLAQTDP